MFSTSAQTKQQPLASKVSVAFIAIAKVETGRVAVVAARGIATVLCVEAKAAVDATTERSRGTSAGSARGCLWWRRRVRFSDR